MGDSINKSKLIKKALFGLIILILVPGTIVFVSAWSFEYRQGWLYLLIFSIFVLFNIIYFYIKDPKLLERRLHGGPGAEKEKSQKIIQVFIRIFFPSMFIISGLDFRFQWSEIPIAPVLISYIFIISGFILIFFVFKENTFTSSAITIHEEQKVISSGLYGIIRHPMYSGTVLLSLFTPIALGSYYALIPGIGMIIIYIARLLNEEKYLISNLPGYRKYTEKVRYKLLPAIW